MGKDNTKNLVGQLIFKQIIKILPRDKFDALVLHSAKDLDEWANQVARCMYVVGIRDTDVFQNTSGLVLNTYTAFLPEKNPY